jgi:hypothetical protein
VIGAGCFLQGASEGSAPRRPMTATRILLGLLLTTALAAPAFAGYTAGGTFVVKSDGQTIVDNGGAICQGLTGSGVGGGCLPFPLADPTGQAGAFIGVRDDAAGASVAFQVCIDNNGDGICGGQPLPTEPCRDQIFFSHSDGGRFFNALGPLPTTSLKGCPNAFQGYVVLLCQGEHNDREAGPHSHTLTTGTIKLMRDGSGYGDFCGGGFGGSAGGFVNTAAKAYKVI